VENAQLEIDAIFAAAIELDSPDERSAYVASACAGDEPMRQRVEDLVDAYFRAGKFLESRPAAGATELWSGVQEGPGSKIGRFKLLEQIGEGGFGVVFMAEQDEPVRRRVALKIIKLGMDSRQVVARFEAERQALAMMDHPNIAKVFDAGSTDTGRPYFVMELVRGSPITQYCNDNRLNVAERLELFSQVCQAVQHAHQKGVIHRDIKPTNVLVATQDDRPVAKVIDFGVAKAMQARLTEKTLFTEFRQLVGTPSYMSPEQATGGLDIDTRSDVYSLGVLLYELLTGAPPFDPEELRSKAFAEMQRIICEVEPPIPSTRLTVLNETLPSIAAQRAVDPRQLAASVRGELDWIVMRCLEKDRRRRYQTATALADDLQRYLSDEPVEARRPTRAYRLKKFIRRNKVGVLAASITLAALIIGSMLATIGFVQARRQAAIASQQEQVAHTQAARSEQVARFLKDMLSGIDPEVALGRDTKIIQEILEKTAVRVNEDLKDQPEVQAELLDTIGTTYRDVGKVDQAVALHRQVLAIDRQLFGDESPEVANMLRVIGFEVSDQGKQDEGERLLRESLAIWLKLKGHDSLEASRAQKTLALMIQRQAEMLSGTARLTKATEAEVNEREALAVEEKLLDHNNLTLAHTYGALALILGTVGKQDEAELLVRKALATYKSAYGDDHPFNVQQLHALAVVISGSKPAEAETLERQALAIRRKLANGNDSPEVAYSMGFLATILHRNGKLAEAEALNREVVQMWKKFRGDHDFYVLGATHSLAAVLFDEGKLAESEEFYRKALAIQKQLPHQGMPSTAELLNALIGVLNREGKTDEAEKLRQEAVKDGSLPSSTPKL
jgi:eukaryotic-like serine/threonine-protein kinase